MVKDQNWAACVNTALVSFYSDFTHNDDREMHTHILR